MKPPYRFRAVEEWKSCLLTLPDSTFFDLMRNIFGNIKTPFNKQRLMEDLNILLSRDDIRKTIAAYLDAEDHKVIAATALLEDPPPEELEDFFEGDMNRVLLRGLLVNLEERLILFRFRDEAREGKRRLALNPVLEPVLAPFASATEILFPFTLAEPARIGESFGAPGALERREHISIADDRVLAALISFISGEDEFYKADGIRKKALEQGKRLFPGLDLEAAAGALQELDLFAPEGEKLLPVNRKIRDFGDLSPRERREYLAAGFYLHLSKGVPGPNGFSDASPGLGFGSRPRNIALLVRRVCGLEDPEKQYPEITFRRRIRFFEREDAHELWGPPEKTRVRVFLKALEMAGVLSSPEGEKSQGLYRKIIPPRTAESPGPVIAMDSAFSFILYPNISLSQALQLAAFSSVRDDTLFGFELSRASVVRGFDLGLTSEAIVNLLTGLSGNPVDGNLEWTLKDWESRYAAVSLYQGLVLSLSEERRYLAETGPVASLIRKTLAPGLYLLSGETPEAAEALRRAGVDIIAQPASGVSESRPGGSRTFSPLEGLGKETLDAPQKNGGKDKEAPDFGSSFSSSSPGDTKERFRRYLERLKIPSRAEKDELLARIERRVVFTEAQLEKAVVKFEKLEARLLDYPGKAAIAKQAIADGSLVEVSWPGLFRPDGPAGSGAVVSVGIPQALEKKEGDSVLVLKPLFERGNKEDGGEGTADSRAGTPETRIPEILRIPLGKIILLRRIKQSIFGE